jgi:uncharacterized protein (TIGR02246 family)
MRNTLAHLIAASTILCGCIGTSPNTSRTPADKAAANDVAAIQKLFADTAAALSDGDISTLAKCYEPDAIQLPPNSPALTGWAAIRSELKKGLKGIKVTATIEVDEICVADSWAYASGTYQMVTTPLAGGEQEVTAGNWLDILRRQPDNSWKIARSTWSIEE